MGEGREGEGGVGVRRRYSDKGDSSSVKASAIPWGQEREQRGGERESLAIHATTLYDEKIRDFNLPQFLLTSTAVHSP